MKTFPHSVRHMTDQSSSIRNPHPHTRTSLINNTHGWMDAGNQHTKNKCSLIRRVARQGTRDEHASHTVHHTRHSARHTQADTEKKKPLPACLSVHLPRTLLLQEHIDNVPKALKPTIIFLSTPP
mmetsp:Transcript_42619/g.120874  ORF Transcript_42619/g.120874 Transcript_42619/m.120874 type:complete len:125 (-) Transcript_42619:152-526(-)